MTPPSPQVSYTMSRIRSKDTSPEKIVRHFLYHSGFRYRLNVHKLPGTPDFVLRKWHTIIFVNGCFWHGHKGCKYHTIPKTNTDYWQEKIRHNIERDEVTTELLQAMGWRVITVWECELKPDKREATLTSLAAQIRDNRQSWLVEKEIRRARRKRNALRQQQARERYDSLIAEIGLEIPESVVRESLKGEE